MSGLRRIEPMPMPDDVAPVLPGGARPQLKWVKPTDLFVDETYQRDLSRKSATLIRTIVQNFAWSRIKPPIVADDAGRLHVIDGQHTAIAAATIGIAEIPVFVVEADAVDARARAFVGHNTDRISVTPIQLYRALVAAGDPDALDVANVCRRAGVRIRQINQSSVVAEGDTMAIASVRRLVNRRGVMRARMTLECLVKAKRAPLTAAEIAAVEHLLCEQKPPADAEALTRAIRIDGDQALTRAQAVAARDFLPVWRVLAARWAKRIGMELA